MRTEEPPDTGELEFVVAASPVSQQSKRGNRDKFASLIRGQMAACTYLLTGDVSIGIEWSIHEQQRYESDASPDVDNILKPLLDTLCGPSGVLIDDCQVQAVSCHWIDWTSRNEQVRIILQFHPDEWRRKEGLLFVHFGQGLCFPLNYDVPPEASLLFVEAIERMLTTRDKLMKRGWDYYTSYSVMPIQRVFHRSRVGRFKVIELSDIRSALIVGPGTQLAEADLDRQKQVLVEVPLGSDGSLDGKPRYEDETIDPAKSERPEPD